MINLYLILGVQFDATQEEIEIAYKRARSSAHPDKLGDASMFDKILKAYEVLGDAEKRKAYDLTGEVENIQMKDSIAVMATSILLEGMEALEESDNPVMTAKKMIRDKNRAGEQEIARLGKKINKLRKQAKKVKGAKKMVEFLKERIEGLVANYEKMDQSCRDTIREGEKLIEYLDNFEWEEVEKVENRKNAPDVRTGDLLAHLKAQQDRKDRNAAWGSFI